ADRTWRYAILSESALRIVRAADRACYRLVSRTYLFSNESLPCTHPRTHAWVNSAQTAFHAGSAGTRGMPPRAAGGGLPGLRRGRPLGPGGRRRLRGSAPPGAPSRVPG